MVVWLALSPSIINVVYGFPLDNFFSWTSLIIFVTSECPFINNVEMQWLGEGFSQIQRNCINFTY